MSITIYTRTSCAPCKTVKRYLEIKGFTYSEKNVDDDPSLMEEVFMKTGMQMVPVVMINDKIIQGANLGLISSTIRAIV